MPSSQLQPAHMVGAKTEWVLCGVGLALTVLSLSCAKSEQAADPGRPDDSCTPGGSYCEGDVSWTCGADGTWSDEHCDSLQGLGCEIDTGVCIGECSAKALGSSYIGCEYFATVTPNKVSSANFEFALAVSNTSDTPANVHIEGGELSDPIEITVEPGSIAVQTLPWVPMLKACMDEWEPNPFRAECGDTTLTSVQQSQGAYHVRSDRPVTVYQFSPLDYERGTVHSYSNDASLLLPVNAMGREHRAVTWPPWEISPGRIMPGFVAVTATHADTDITVQTTADVPAGEDAPGFAPGVPGSVLMQEGDVLLLMSYDGDLSGTRVLSTHPVQVIAGHYCTRVPSSQAACDHLEDVMFPVETLAGQYYVTAPALPALPNGKVRYVRMVATADNTSLSYDPPQSGAPTLLARAGDMAEIPAVAGDFEIRASERLVVAEFMMAQEAGGGAGDPAMAVAVNARQFRTDYQFHAPLNYETNYVNVVAPSGARIELDGVAITSFSGIGSAGFGVGRVELGSGNDGNHTITGDSPFGITVYGYGEYTSYWYPGGLDLEVFEVE